MKRILILLSITFILLVFFSPDLSAQCAMCKAVAESGTENGNKAAAGLNSGILYLVMIPYLILGSLVFLWWKYFRNREAN